MPIFVFVALILSASNAAEPVNDATVASDMANQSNARIEVAALGSAPLYLDSVSQNAQSAATAHQWQLRMEDGRLDKALRRWAAEAGYSFRWDADRYVLIAAPTIFTGTFEGAVEQVLDTPGIKQSEYPLEACVYDNQPPLLRITRLGDQKEECK